MSASRLDGPGTQTVQLSDKDGFVILHFEKPVAWVKLDPVTAGRLAAAMAKACYVAVHGSEPDEGARLVTEQLRIRLRNRVALMLRSFAGKTPVPAYEIQASEVVDACLKEAT